MNIDQIRRDTLGCHDKIFLNSAGASLPPQIVVERMTEYLTQEALIGGYELAAQRSAQFDEFYIAVAKLLHTEPRNIAFTYNATDAFARALSAIPFQENEVILTTNDDYISNQIAFFSLQKRFGIEIIRAQNLTNGDLDLDDFERKIKAHSPKLVAITHIPTNSGMIQDAVSVGKLCKQYGIYFLLDACQSVGQIDVNVQELQCDFLSATSRKFLRGARGTGFLYVSDRALQDGLAPLFLDMRGADWTQNDDYTLQTNNGAQRFEMWEFSYATLIGTAEAVKYANQLGMNNIEVRNQELSQYLRDKLGAIETIRVLDRGSRKGSILTFHAPNRSLEETTQLLKAHRINHSISLREFALIDYTQKGVDWAIRLSPHYFNTFEELDTVVEVLGT